MGIEWKRGQTVLKERINWRQASLNKKNSKLFFHILHKAGYVDLKQGGRTVIMKRDLKLK